MPILKSKIDRVREVVRQHVDWFIGRVFGNQYTDDQAHVEAPNSVEGLPTTLTQMSFVLGKEEAQLKESEWKGYTWGAMTHAAGQVSPEEQMQIDAASFSAFSRFRKLGDDVANGIFDRLAAANNQAVSEAQIRGIIADKIETGVLLGRSHSDVAQDLARALKDNSRDWYRVAATELHHARQQGVAHAIVNKVGIYKHGEGSDSLVAVVPMSNACKDCVRLYLENGKPRVFRLLELLQNAGTNYVRPWRENAQPVVPPLHPHCYCRLRYVPPGWGWDDKGKFTLVDPEKAFPMIKSNDLIPGGLAEGKTNSDFDPESLKEGIKVEMEHTDDPKVAAEIARDHLTEDKDYYVKLRTIEGNHDNVSKAVGSASHSLLQASNASLPTDDYIRQVTDLNELQALKRRLEKLEQMYIRDPDIHERVSHLLHMARVQWIKVKGIVHRGGSNE
jgi:hypothetical protein